MHKQTSANPSGRSRLSGSKSRSLKRSSKSPKSRRTFSNTHDSSQSTQVTSANATKQTNTPQPSSPTNPAGGKVSQKQMKVVHLTDLHWLSKVPPTLPQMFTKRVLGYANLYFNKRIEHFTDTARTRTLKKIDELQPDLIICTGDITTTGLDSEFLDAYGELKPLMDKYPFFMIPGNHDIYTPTEEKNNTITQYFHSVLHKVLPQNINLINKDSKKSASKSISINNSKHTLSTTVDNLVSPDVQAQFPDLSLFMTKNKKGGSDDGAYCLVVGLNPCRATFSTSSGEYPIDQLEQLSKLLNQTTDAPLFTDAKGKKQVKPFIILSTHYPVVDRTGVDYAQLHSNHGVVNNHVLLRVLNEASIKPGLILHGHDHLGLASGLITNRVNEPISDPTTPIQNATKPPFSKKHLPNYYNINYDTRPHPITRRIDYDAEGNPQLEYQVPTVNDIVHSYSSVYTQETLSTLQESLVSDLTQQKAVYNSRENLRKTDFKTINPVLQKFRQDQAEVIFNQTGHYFHTAPPLPVNEYLNGTMKPVSVLQFIPKQMKNGNPVHYDAVEKQAYDDTINKKEKELEKLLKERPNEVDLTVPLREQARLYANEKEKTLLVVDTTKQTTLAANLAKQVVIPIHNPGSGALSGYSPLNPSDWPKVAGINTYNVISRLAPLPQPKGSKAYVSSDYFSIKLDGFVQDAQGNFVQTQPTFPPYSYPLY